MIKKILSLLIIFMMTAPITLANVGTPEFNFAIDDYFNTASTFSGDNTSSGGGGSSGLSGGEITAITLGSIGGAALLGLGGWLYKNKTAQSLAAGYIRGVQNPLIPFCMDTNPNSEVYARINNNYPYLRKALSLNEIHYCPDSKYLLIYDTTIEKRKYDSARFEIPQGTKSMKITQVSDPYKEGELTSELFLYPDNTASTQPDTAVLTDLTNEETQRNGILIRSVNITKNYQNGVYVVSNYSGKKIYAVVIEFIF